MIYERVFCRQSDPSVPSQRPPPLGEVPRRGGGGQRRQCRLSTPQTGSPLSLRQLPQGGSSEIPQPPFKPGTGSAAAPPFTDGDAASHLPIPSPSGGGAPQGRRGLLARPADAGDWVSCWGCPPSAFGISPRKGGRKGNRASAAPPQGRGRSGPPLGGGGG